MSAASFCNVDWTHRTGAQIMTTVIDKQKNCFVYFKFFACYCYGYNFDHLCYCLLLVFNYFICKYGCHKKKMSTGVQSQQGWRKSQRLQPVVTCSIRVPIIQEYCLTHLRANNLLGEKELQVYEINKAAKKVGVKSVHLLIGFRTRKEHTWQ